MRRRILIGGGLMILGISTVAAAMVPQKARGWGVCPITGIEGPAHAVGVCSMTGQVGPPHELSMCPASGQRGPEQGLTIPVSEHIP
jgi:hypothetical protein